MKLPGLALKSLRHRLFATIATTLSIVLSLLLLFSVERVRRSVEDSFTQAISGVDLIVGARTGSLNLVLFSVFNLGQPTNNVSFETYEKIAALPEVEWTIPYSLGDGHKGYRVVATNADFFKYYKVRVNQAIKLEQGKEFSGAADVVLGAEVAKVLKYKIGDQIVLAHGSTSGDSFDEHAEHPFTVVGIMESTGTAIDRSLYVSLSGLEALHEEDEKHEAHGKHDEHKEHEHHGEHEPKEITAFFLKSKSKAQILNLQREITNNKSEALLAVIPAVVLSELWKSLSQIEVVLKIISALVMVVGLVGMIVALISSLNERRREMAILRSLGASYSHLAKLVLWEVFIILSSAIVLSIAIKVLMEIILADFLQRKFGLFLSGSLFSTIDIMMMITTLVFGFVFALFPVYVFKKKSLKDGLAVK